MLTQTTLLPPLAQVSIVPRGSAALGFAQYLPNENMLMTTEQVGVLEGGGARGLCGLAAQQFTGVQGTGWQWQAPRPLHCVVACCF